MAICAGCEATLLLGVEAPEGRDATDTGVNAAGLPHDVGVKTTG
jgi:hypothetical protein